MSKTEKEYIKLIKKNIEEKFFPDIGPLRVRDLEYLIEVIKEKSGITLSLSTLKRLWKEDFSQTPQPSTLKALVSTLGYKTWQDFMQKDSNSASRKSVQQPNTKHYVWLLLLIAITGVIWTVSSNKFLQKRKDPVVKGDIQFSADKTKSIGVPNTVIFKYDLSNVQADSFFIQQSWNQDHKEQIDPSNHILSSIYYTPSFHQAKLLANDSIIAKQNVHILSQGWMPYVKYNMRDRIPIYLGKENMVLNGKLSITEADLEEAGVNLENEFKLRYCNIRDFDQIDDSNFSIKTKLKCDSVQALICPYMELMLVFEEDIFWIELTKKGCESNISYKIGEMYFSGKENDLSEFGCDIYKWQELELRVENKFAKLSLNGNSVIDLAYSQEFGKLMGLIYTFAGAGSVDFVQLKGADGNMVYDDQFD